jgi:hypothetical protein
MTAWDMYRDSWLIISTRPSSQRDLKGPRPQQHNRKGIQLHRPAPPSRGEWGRAFRIFTALGRIFLQEIFVLPVGCNSRGFRSISGSTEQMSEFHWTRLQGKWCKNVWNCKILIFKGLWWLRVMRIKLNLGCLHPVVCVRSGDGFFFISV